MRLTDGETEIGRCTHPTQSLNNRGDYVQRIGIAGMRLRPLFVASVGLLSSDHLQPEDAREHTETAAAWRELLKLPDLPVAQFEENETPGPLCEVRLSQRDVSIGLIGAALTLGKPQDRERVGAEAGMRRSRSAVSLFPLNSWVPRKGTSRDEYFVTAVGEESPTYRPELVKRQPTLPIVIG